MDRMPFNSVDTGVLNLYAGLLKTAWDGKKSLEFTDREVEIPFFLFELWEMISQTPSCGKGRIYRIRSTYLPFA